MSDAALLTTALEATHAAVYGYGVLGARLPDDERASAGQAQDVQRARRDQLVGALLERGAPAPAPEPGYDVAVADRDSALLLAVRLEEGLGVRWRDLVSGTDDRRLRRLGVSALQESALRATRWRQLAGVLPATVALPGI